MIHDFFFLQVFAALLLSGSALTAIVPVLPKTLLPPPVERPESRQLDGAVHQTLTVGSEGGGTVAARVTEITDDVTDDWTNEISLRRRRRDAERVSMNTRCFLRVHLTGTYTMLLFNEYRSFCHIPYLHK